MTGEPLIHSHVTDELPDDHALASLDIYCANCAEMLHAGYNECMQTWIEAGCGNYCLKCFAAECGSGVLLDKYGLPGDDE